MPPRRSDRLKRRNEEKSSTAIASGSASAAAATADSDSDDTANIRTKRNRTSVKPVDVPKSLLRQREAMLHSRTVSAAIELSNSAFSAPRIRVQEMLAGELTTFFESDASSPFSPTTCDRPLLFEFIPLIVGYWSSYRDIEVFDNECLVAAFGDRNFAKSHTGHAVVRTCRMRLLNPLVSIISIPTSFEMASDWKIRVIVESNNDIHVTTQLFSLGGSFKEVRVHSPLFTINIRSPQCTTRSLYSYIHGLLEGDRWNLTSTAIDPDVSDAMPIPEDAKRAYESNDGRLLALEWTEIQVVLDEMCYEIFLSRYAKARELVNYIRSEVEHVRRLIRVHVARVREEAQKPKVQMMIAESD